MSYWQPAIVMALGIIVIAVGLVRPEIDNVVPMGIYLTGIGAFVMVIEWRKDVKRRKRSP